MPITRLLPCIALKVDSDVYLLDPGEGCQAKMFRTGLSPLKVKVVFITHGHGDHYLGLPGLLQSMTLSNRKEPLTIAVPKQLKDALVAVLKSGLVKPGFKLDLLGIDENFIYVDPKISAKPFPVDHGVEAYGFHITVGKKTLCYTGDTAPVRSVIESCKGVDILIHEATFTGIYEKEAHEQKHSTSVDAAKVALECGAKMLILFHISARHGVEETFFDAYRIFKNTVVAVDGMMVML
ncbi:MAG: ribonuclease Z, partial [Desulfurococcaceae archaeon]